MLRTSKKTIHRKQIGSYIAKAKWIDAAFNGAAPGSLQSYIDDANRKALIEQRAQYVVLCSGHADPFVTRSPKPTDITIYKATLYHGRLRRSAVALTEFNRVQEGRDAVIR